MAVALLALVLDTLWMKDAYFAGLSGAFGVTQHSGYEIQERTGFRPRCRRAAYSAIV